MKLEHVAALVRQRLRQSMLSDREGARAMNVSPSTLCRFLKGRGNPDAPTVLAILEWLQLPAGAVWASPAINQRPDTLTTIYQLLLSDPKLTPQEATVLYDTIRPLYLLWATKDASAPASKE